MWKLFRMFSYGKVAVVNGITHHFIDERAEREFWQGQR